MARGDLQHAEGPEHHGKKIQLDALIEMLGGPGAGNRSTSCLRKSFTRAAISTNFIDGPHVPSGRPQR